jgi:1,4-alpha-glucan branching enzyme
MVALNLDAEWTGAMTEMSWWKSAVIYQIYPCSFQDTDGDAVGDLRGIVRRIPYLIELGVDAIWISPIFRSPMADFGYDVSDYIDIDPLFGTMQDAFGYRWYRVGGLDYLLKRSDIDEENARTKLGSGARATPR